MNLRHVKKQCLDDIKNEYVRLGSIFQKKTFTEASAIQRVQEIMLKMQENGDQESVDLEEGVFVWF